MTSRAATRSSGASRISFWTYFVEPVSRLITARGEKTVWMNGASPPSPSRDEAQRGELLAVGAAG